MVGAPWPRSCGGGGGDGGSGTAAVWGGFYTRRFATAPCASVDQYNRGTKGKTGGKVKRADGGFCLAAGRQSGRESNGETRSTPSPRQAVCEGNNRVPATNLQEQAISPHAALA